MEKLYHQLIKPLYSDIKTLVLDTLFPITCLSCGREGELLCLPCRSSLKPLDHQICIMCKKPAPFGITHAGCQTPQGADGLVSFYDYRDEKVSNAIITGKYKFIPGIYEFFGELIAELLSDHYSLFTDHFSLVPIPLYPMRKRWRGFNQAEVICQSLSKHLYLPVSNLLERKKYTRTQKDLKRDERLKNVDGVFGLSPSYNKRRAGGDITDDTIRGHSFLVIDDVTTTGATLLEAAKVLKRNGAAKVWCLTFARD